MQGETGAPGTPGSDGATGPAGPQGLRGVQGETGAPGTPGSDGATGPAGPQGPAGPSGPQGLRGVQGETGARGTPGSDGATGDTGPAGPRGPAGPNGPAGPSGPRGMQGVPGETGARGARGSDGATGPAGPRGPAGGLSQYAYIYNLTPRTVPVEADVIFDSNGIMTSGITHAPGSAQIAIVNPGDYKVTFSVSGTEPNQIAVFIDGDLVPGTIYGSGAGTQQNTGQAIIRIAGGDILTVRNHTSAAAVGLQSLAGGTQANANASVAIEKLD